MIFLNTSMALDFSFFKRGGIVGTRPIYLFSKDSVPRAFATIKIKIKIIF